LRHDQKEIRKAIAATDKTFSGSLCARAEASGQNYFGKAARPYYQKADSIPRPREANR
jgi:hypothetical protein